MSNPDGSMDPNRGLYFQQAQPQYQTYNYAPQPVAQPSYVQSYYQAPAQPMPQQQQNVYSYSQYAPQQQYSAPANVYYQPPPSQAIPMTQSYAAPAPQPYQTYSYPAQQVAPQQTSYYTTQGYGAPPQQQTYQPQPQAPQQTTYYQQQQAPQQTFASLPPTYHAPPLQPTPLLQPAAAPAAAPPTQMLLQPAQPFPQQQTVNALPPAPAPAAKRRREDEEEDKPAAAKKPAVAKGNAKKAAPSAAATEKAKVPSCVPAGCTCEDLMKAVIEEKSAQAQEDGAPSPLKTVLTDLKAALKSASEAKQSALATYLVDNGALGSLCQALTFPAHRPLTLRCLHYTLYLAQRHDVVQKLGMDVAPPLLATLKQSAKTDMETALKLIRACCKLADYRTEFFRLKALDALASATLAQAAPRTLSSNQPYWQLVKTIQSLLLPEDDPDSLPVEEPEAILTLVRTWVDHIAQSEPRIAVDLRVTTTGSVAVKIAQVVAPPSVVYAPDQLAAISQVIAGVIARCAPSVASAASSAVLAQAEVLYEKLRERATPPALRIAAASLLAAVVPSLPVGLLYELRDQTDLVRNLLALENKSASDDSVGLLRLLSALVKQFLAERPDLLPRRDGSESESDAANVIVSALHLERLSPELAEMTVSGSLLVQRASALLLRDLTYAPSAAAELTSSPQLTSLLFDLFFGRAIRGSRAAPETRVALAGVCWNLSIPKASAAILQASCPLDELLRLLSKNPALDSDLVIPAVAILTNLLRGADDLRTAALKKGVATALGNLMAAPVPKVVELASVAIKQIVLTPGLAEAAAAEYEALQELTRALGKAAENADEILVLCADRLATLEEHMKRRTPPVGKGAKAKKEAASRQPSARPEAPAPAVAPAAAPAAQAQEEPAPAPAPPAQKKVGGRPPAKKREESEEESESEDESVDEGAEATVMEWTERADKSRQLPPEHLVATGRVSRNFVHLTTNPWIHGRPYHARNVGVPVENAPPPAGAELEEYKRMSDTLIKPASAAAGPSAPAPAPVPASAPAKKSAGGSKAEEDSFDTSDAPAPAPSRKRSAPPPSSKPSSKSEEKEEKKKSKEKEKEPSPESSDESGSESDSESSDSDSDSESEEGKPKKRQKAARAFEQGPQEWVDTVIKAQYKPGSILMYRGLLYKVDKDHGVRKRKGSRFGARESKRALKLDDEGMPLPGQEERLERAKGLRKYKPVPPTRKPAKEKRAPKQSAGTSSSPEKAKKESAEPEKVEAEAAAGGRDAAEVPKEDTPPSTSDGSGGKHRRKPTQVVRSTMLSSGEKESAGKDKSTVHKLDTGRADRPSREERYDTEMDEKFNAMVRGGSDPDSGGIVIVEEEEAKATDLTAAKVLSYEDPVIVDVTTTQKKKRKRANRDLEALHEEARWLGIDPLLGEQKARDRRPVARLNVTHTTSRVYGEEAEVITEDRNNQIFSYKRTPGGASAAKEKEKEKENHPLNILASTAAAGPIFSPEKEKKAEKNANGTAVPKELLKKDKEERKEGAEGDSPLPIDEHSVEGVMALLGAKVKRQREEFWTEDAEGKRQRKQPERLEIPLDRSKRTYD